MLDSNLLALFGDKNRQKNLYAEKEKWEAQICKCIREGLKVMPWVSVYRLVLCLRAGFLLRSTFISFHLQLLSILVDLQMGQFWGGIQTSNLNDFVLCCLGCWCLFLVSSATDIHISDFLKRISQLYPMTSLSTLCKILHNLLHPLCSEFPQPFLSQESWEVLWVLLMLLSAPPL